jgi:hypothetical protein
MALQHFKHCSTSWAFVVAEEETLLLQISLHVCYWLHNPLQMKIWSGSPELLSTLTA